MTFETGFYIGIIFGLSMWVIAEGYLFDWLRKVFRRGKNGKTN